MATKAPSPKIAAKPPPAPAFMAPELGALVVACEDAEEVVEVEVEVEVEVLVAELELDEPDEELFDELVDGALDDDDTPDERLPVPPETLNVGE